MPEHLPAYVERTARSSWLLLRAGGQVLARLVWEWRALPRPARRCWLRRLMIGWALTFAAMFVLGAAGRSLSVSGRLAFEGPLLRELVAEIPISFDAAIWMGAPANPVFLTTLTLGIALVAAWLRYPLASLSILASFFMVDLVIIAGWSTWNRPRPELVYGGVAVPGLHSFPSGHITQATAVYGVLLYLWVYHSRSRLEQVVVTGATLGLLLLAALTRLRLGVHWPSDVVTGFIIGLLWASVVAWNLHRTWTAPAFEETFLEEE